MNTVMKPFIALCAGLVLACSTSPDAKPVESAGESTVVNSAEAPAVAQHTAPHPDPIKTGAPVDMSLSATGQAGQVRVTLKFSVTTDVPEVIARFVVPAGVSVEDGTVERQYGAMAAGSQVTHTVTLNVPAEGRFKLGAGVDCVMHAGMTLNSARVLFLGTAKAPEDRSRVVRPANSNTGLRLSPAK